MAAPMVCPSARVAAARRRAFLWLPMLVAGVLVSVAGGPMIDVFNSLDVAAVVLLAAGVLGLAWEAGK